MTFAENWQNRLLVKLEALNIGLSVLVVLVAAWIFVLPATPEIVFSIQGLGFSKQMESQALENPANSHTSGVWLHIPKIFVDGEAFPGEASALDKGFWLRSAVNETAINDNIVIAAHRFRYTFGPQTFYHLDKLNVGDRILLEWQGEKLHYIVTRTFNTLPDDTNIEAPTGKPQLTLYTCGPLWGADYRLVVIAEPIDGK